MFVSHLLSPLKIALFTFFFFFEITARVGGGVNVIDLDQELELIEKKRKKSAP